MSDKVTVIFRLNDGYDEDALSLIAQESLDTYGIGGHPDASKTEGFLGEVNTPVSNGYFRVRMLQTIAALIEEASASGVESEYITLERVEWNGQDMVLRDDGETYEKQLFETGTTTYTDDDGEEQTVAQYLGRL